MTPQQQRIALAEWAGWTFIHGESELDPDKDRIGYLAGNPPDSGRSAPYPQMYKDEVPDYLSDLNAVHELVSKLSDSQYDGEDGFTATLAFVTQGKDAPELGWKFRPMQEATAAQRCEALLRTLGLWKD